ncbi:MAG: outer membrane protein OmpA-like peptidoglycan-associated protein [Sulfitobacter sp.]|jgi:outer membrane protein OmpA-like peptidoglycan-associated protein
MVQGGVLVMLLAAIGTAGLAQTRSQTGRDKGVYVPSIWVDPDGCEHWVMDDGAEGYMSPHLTRDGKPVCGGGNLCGVLSSDQFFATDSFKVGASGRDRLNSFFQSENARAYVITGHTDSRASDAYNMRLSLNRAKAVARIAAQNGANVSDVRGFGERQPAASNDSASGRAKNRRVEIICVR